MPLSRWLRNRTAGRSQPFPQRCGIELVGRLSCSSEQSCGGADGVGGGQRQGRRQIGRDDERIVDGWRQRCAIRQGISTARSLGDRDRVDVLAASNRLEDLLVGKGEAGGGVDEKAGADFAVVEGDGGDRPTATHDTADLVARQKAAASSRRRDESMQAMADDQHIAGHRMHLRTVLSRRLLGGLQLRRRGA